MPARLDADAHLAQLRAQGERVAAAAARGDPDAAVPTCPGWTLRELVQHVGRVHRRVAMVIEQRRPDHRGIPLEELGPMPADAELAGWYREGVARVHGAISRLSPEDRDVATFGPASSPRAFWARRQALEAAIHGLDAEAAAGVAGAPFDPEFAADGIEEVWDVFLGWLTQLRTDPVRSLHLHATDAAGEWLVMIGPEEVGVERAHGKGDCAVRGPASELFALVWNRRGREGLEVFGDSGVLDLWRDRAHI